MIRFFRRLAIGAGVAGDRATDPGRRSRGSYMASAPHQDAALDFDHLQSAKNYRAIKTYDQSKTSFFCA
jgi:hypothetical protein